MLNTVKKRLLFLTFTLLLVMSISVISIAISSFITNRSNRIKNTQTHVSYLGGKITDLYEEHKNYAKELATLGTLFYNSQSQDKSIIYNTIETNFKNHLPKAGVGIWFEPNIISKNREWFCIFAYDKDNKIVFNETLENKEYDYLSKSWYKLIKQKSLNNEKNIYIPTTCTATGKETFVLTIGTGIYSGNKLIGTVTVDWKLDEIKNKISNLKPTKNSYILFADKDNDFIITLTNTNKDVVSKSLSIFPWYKDNLKSGSVIKDNKKYYITFPRVLDNGLLLIVNVPIRELFGDLYINLISIILIMLLAVILVTSISYFILTLNVNKPIQYLVSMAKNIGSGNLDAKMKIEKPEEFAQLANAFNKMTTDIETYITNLNKVTTEKNRIESELSIAHAIQSSSLPSVFPPYPERKEFDIFADMVPAKEVGGDFYDFFFIDKDHFVFVVADVSGKGVPAALFMMEVKTLLKNIVQTGIPLDEAMNKINNTISNNNKLGFFVTILLTEINLTSGKITFLNAGHNHPLIQRENGKVEYHRVNPNLVVGVSSDFKYVKEETYLKPNDRIFLYTDGITEAMNTSCELYGNDRLKEILFVNSATDIKETVINIKKDISKFVNGANQSDDITSVIFKYNGKNNFNTK